MNTRPPRLLALALVVLAFVGAGCASEAATDALRRVGDVGPRIAEDIKPTDEGGEARKAEFLKLCEECRKLGEK